MSRRMQQTLGTASNLSPLKVASVKYRGKTIIYSVFNKNVDAVLSGETYSLKKKKILDRSKVHIKYLAMR